MSFQLFPYVQAEVEQLQRKYNHAKRVIAELKRHEQFLAVQLRERDHEYNSHLRALRGRVAALERELADTRRAAGIPGTARPDEGDYANASAAELLLGGGPGGGGLDLSPPELLKQPPVRVTRPYISVFLRFLFATSFLPLRT